MKEPKRSEWFDGVLKAEDWLCHHKNYKTNDYLFLEDEDGMTEYIVYWRNSVEEKPWPIAKISREQGQGVLDYMDFIEKGK